MASYDYRAARDRVMGILRDGDGKPVAYVPSKTPIRERMLLVALVEFAPDIRPALSTLGIMVGLGWREVHRLLRSLERKGLIRIESRPGQASRYHLTLTPVNPDTPVESDTPVGSDKGTPVNPDTPPLSTPTTEADKEAGNTSGQDIGAPSEPPTKPKRRKSRSSSKASKPVTELPADWKPTASHKALAAEHGLDLKLEAVGFRGHYQGRKELSWNGRFTTWLANQAKWNRERGTRKPNGAQRHQHSGVDVTQGCETYDA